MCISAKGDNFCDFIFFPFRTDSFSNGNKTILKEFSPLKVYPIAFNASVVKFFADDIEIVFLFFPESRFDILCRLSNPIFWEK